MHKAGYQCAWEHFPIFIQLTSLELCAVSVSIRTCDHLIQNDWEFQ